MEKINRKRKIRLKVRGASRERKAWEKVDTRLYEDDHLGGQVVRVFNE